MEFTKIFTKKQIKGEKMAQVKNYSEKDVSMMIELYTANPTRETVDTLAENLAKIQEASSLSYQERASTNLSQE